MNAGAMYYYAKPTSMINPFGGVSFYHLNNPSESFLGETNKLKIRTEGNLRCQNRDYQQFPVMPKIFSSIRKATELTYAAQGQFYLSNYDLFLLGGLTYRNKDAAIIEFGAKYGNFIGRMSYDINTSSLNDVSRGRGGSNSPLPTSSVLQT
ncbi:MAG: type IX secretion system membrane protein PorP/SprF [Crocinitomicaceae bacterium]|nr:type IX secretion system membrane protein PorP/SprF [Crocinitomicaceae bacterium]